MELRNRLSNDAVNAVSVLKIGNMKRIVSNVLRIEKNAVMGVAAETLYALALMLAAFLMASVLTFLSRL